MNLDTQHAYMPVCSLAIAQNLMLSPSRRLLLLLGPTAAFLPYYMVVNTFEHTQIPLEIDRRSSERSLPQEASTRHGDLASQHFVVTQKKLEVVDDCLGNRKTARNGTLMHL